MKKSAILFLIFFVFGTVFAQDNAGLYFFPSEKVYEPLQSAVFEARIGVLKDIDNNMLRLDIGASPEIIGFGCRHVSYSAGVDFFTFSNLMAEDNFKFPVDAIDYFFGVNLNMRKELNSKSELQGRLRISHISSHLQDGHVYERSDTIFIPFVYSREFIQIDGNYTKRINDNFAVRGFLGVEYLFSTIPKNFGKLSVRFGIESSVTLSRLSHFYFSNESSVKEVNGKSNLNNNLEIGLKIGELKSRGVRLYFNYYDGQDYKGQYFDKMISYKAIGFKIEL